MSADATLAKLREPFAPELVGKLPKVTCKACSNKNCQNERHKPSKCGTCDAWISAAHMHVDFVGHAHVTDRLLTVDPEWCWEPMAFGPDGLPAIGRSTNGREAVLWIRLTVGGITRPGVGVVEAGAFDAEKQLIGDAIKNAAMRFGVALELWAKTELESSLLPAPDPEAPSTASAPARPGAEGSPPPSAPADRPARQARPAAAPSASAKRVSATWVKGCIKAADDAGLSNESRRELVEMVTEGRTQSFSGLLEHEGVEVLAAITAKAAA